MKTLVLAPSFAPIEEIPVQRAVVLLLEGKAQSVENHPTRVFRNATGRVRIPAPVVIVLKALADFAGVVFGRATWSRHNVYLRDNFTCQYCGRHERELIRTGPAEVVVRYGSGTAKLVASGESLTIDHVTPIAQGGKNTYENTVTACSSCNNRKDNRTPAQAKMYLRKKPRALTRAEAFLGKLSPESRAVVDELFAV